MPIQGMDVLSISRQLETTSSGATMSTNANDGFGTSLADILPIEMIQAICKHLPYKDIVNFRLVSNICAAAGMDRLVEDIFVIFTRKSFEKLLNISKHPGMSKHVTAIHCNPLRVKAVSEDQYKNVLKDEEQPRLESLTDMVHDIEARNKICEEQDLMVKSEFSSFIFSQVLPKLNSLKKFTMGVWGTRQYDCLRLNIKPTPLFHNSMGHDNARYHKEASIFLAAAANAGTKLDYLYLQKFNMNMLFDAHLGKNGILPYKPDPRYLRHLRLQEMRTPTANANRGFKQLLQATSNLEHLLISRQCNGTQSTNLDWDEIIVGLTMPHLKSVNFTVLGGSKLSLTEFLQRHARTLRSLELRLCFLREPIKDWGEVFDGIKSDLTLREVGLSYLSSLLPEDQSNCDRTVEMKHIYHGNPFHLLLKDRLMHKNLLAKESSLVPSELWQNYILYVATEKQKAEVRQAELESQGLMWDSENDDDMWLWKFATWFSE